MNTQGSLTGPKKAILVRHTSVVDWEHQKAYIDVQTSIVYWTNQRAITDGHINR